MTEDEEFLLHQVVNDYWNEFSRLIAKHLSRVPEDLRDELMMQLQDHSSCYGTNYEKYMK